MRLPLVPQVNRILALLMLLALPARGEDSGRMQEQPDILARIIAAMAESTIDVLTSKTYTHEGGEYSYHLRSADYVGTLERNSKRYYIATAFFLRSSAKGSEYPPARGHGFIMILDAKFAS